MTRDEETKRKCKRNGNVERRVVISVMAGVEVMIERRRMKCCNGGRGDDKVRE